MSTNVFLDNEQFEFLLKAAVDQAGATLTLRSEGDGTLRIYGLQVGVDSNGQEIIFLAEDDGTHRGQVILWDFTGGQQIRAAAEPTTGQQQISLFGHDGAALQRVMLETTGEQRVVMMGADSGNNLDRILTDVSRIARQRGYEPWRWVDSVALAPGAGYSTVFTAPASTHVAMEYSLVATANNPLIDVHVVGSGDAVGVANATFISAAPTVGALPYRDGPYIMEPGATLQARNTAAAGNTGTIHAWVEYYSTGDAV